MFRFDLWPLLLSQRRVAKLKSAYNSLLLVIEVCNGKPTYRKFLWAGNLVMCSDLLLGMEMENVIFLENCDTFSDFGQTLAPLDNKDYSFNSCE